LAIEENMITPNITQEGFGEKGINRERRNRVGRVTRAERPSPWRNNDGVEEAVFRNMSVKF
jgi:hypothetical protein